MKVCHITSVHEQSDVRIFLKECSSLAKNYETHLIVINGYDDYINNVQIHGVSVKYKNRIQRFTKAVRTALKKAIIIDAKIYHIHDPELLRIARKLKSLGKKVIYDAHEDLPRQIMTKQWLPKACRKILGSIIEKYENKIASKIDAIVTATPHIKTRFLKVNKQTVNINNYPIITEYSFQTNISKNSKDPKIVYTGGISKMRGIIDVIIALENIDVKLLLAGKYLEPTLRSELLKLKSWNKVIEKGFLSKDDVYLLYQESFLGIVTLHPTVNYLDSLPVKMFEYMAAGLPIIASNFPIWKQIIEENNVGICVNPQNPSEIAKAIKLLQNNPEEAIKMGENGIKAVKEKYNWGIEEKKLFTLYKELD